VSHFLFNSARSLKVLTRFLKNKTNRKQLIKNFFDDFLLLLKKNKDSERKFNERII